VTLPLLVGSPLALILSGTDVVPSGGRPVETSGNGRRAHERVERPPPRRASRKKSARSAARRREDRIDELLDALEAMADGDFSVRLDAGRRRDSLDDFALAFNEVVERNASLARELARLQR